MSNLSVFEHNFIERTYPSVVSDVSIAFAELVANAWDAGASTVNITLPQKYEGKIVIEDNGSGMTDDEFRSRWMVIAYNRVDHQGQYTEFELENKQKARRIAYGRNGVGRHSLVCFDNSYTIETWKNGVLNRYDISVDGGESAFSIVNYTTEKKEGHGTRITVVAKKKVPNVNEVIKTLGYKFMFDPNFNLYINGAVVEHYKNLQADRIEEIQTKYGVVKVEIFKVPDGEKNTTNNGISFWVNKRLVGNPSWSVGNTKVEDARRKFAQKHIIIVTADFLIDEIAYDWSGFRNTEKVLVANKAIVNFIRKYRIEYYKGKISDVKDEVVRSNRVQISKLSIPGLYDLKNFLNTYLEQKPEIEIDDLNIIISSLVNVLRSDSGLSLLSKLAEMSERSIDTLDEILSEWSVNDIKCIIDEIDSRLSVIDAIRKLCSDKNTDELHVLHPLVASARWLFGIEFDNPNYTSNRTLTTVMKTLIEGERKVDTSINWNKRPDLVLAEDFSLSATCTEDFDDNDILVIQKVLIIELKKGGFTIGRKEINQVEEYVDAIVKGNKLNSRPKIKAFVIGDSIDSSVSTSKKQEDYGEVYAYTYSQLVGTAEKRLFNLKTKLEEHYAQYNGSDYIEKILNEPVQISMLDNDSEEN